MVEFGDLSSVENSFIAITPWSTDSPGVVVPVRVPSIGRIDLFENDLYYEGL